MNSSITSLSPTPRYGKHGWYNQYQKHNLLLNKSKAKLLIIGLSLVSNLSRSPEIVRKYFSNHWFLNFGIAEYKAQNVLWRVKNLHFTSNLHLKYIFILCSTNKIDHNSPQYIASTKLLLYYFYTTFNTVNKLLKFQCLNNGFYFLEFKSNWLNNDDSLNMEFFYNDYLHLIRKGNELLAK